LQASNPHQILLMLFASQVLSHSLGVPGERDLQWDIALFEGPVSDRKHGRT